LSRGWGILLSQTGEYFWPLTPWAKFRQTKSAIKIHALLNLQNNIPSFISITDGSVHDVNILDELVAEIGAFYVIDKGYIDFERFYKLNISSAYFVTRAKENLNFKRIYSHQVDKSLGLICDQSIFLKGFYPSQYYPEKLRRIKFFDSQNNRRLIFLTNNFRLPAITIANLFKQRWQIELFFKWIKQNLKIKSFYGNSPNAVKTQICIAISVYVLLAIIKKKLKIEHSLYTFLQLVIVSIFEKTPIISMFSDSNYINEIQPDYNQLSLFNL
jgi:transposase